MGPPRLTTIGRGVIMATDMKITFFELCVLAKVYSMVKRIGGMVPLPSVERVFEDWPKYDRSIQNALASLRRHTYLPRARQRIVLCDVKRLDGIGAELDEISKWVDHTGVRVRNILLGDGTV